MRFLLALLLTACLSFLAGLYLPWWSIALCAFLVGLFIRQKASYQFLSAFFAVFIFWAALAWWIDIKNESILSQKIAALFHLGQSTLLLILITAFLGGLTSGLAALTAAYLRPPIKSRRKYNP